MTRNPDILVELTATRSPGQVVVGFAAETGDDTGDVLHHGRAKLARKGADLLVVNAVGDGRAFEVPDNAGWLLGADGSEAELPTGSKAAAGVARLGRRRRAAGPPLLTRSGHPGERPAEAGRVRSVGLAVSPAGRRGGRRRRRRRSGVLPVARVALVVSRLAVGAAAVRAAPG